MGWDMLATFLEGIATFVSPCLLPLLPVYVAFFAGDAAGGNGAGLWRTLVRALGFVAGFAAPFALLGAFSGAAGSLLVAHRRALEACCGVLVVAMGLGYLGILRFDGLALPGFGMAGTRTGAGRTGRWAPVALGVTFAVCWTPCVGTFLASALSLAAASGSAWRGVVLLLAYSLGLGVPFVLSALLIDQLQGAFGWVKAHYELVERVCGTLLVAVGLLMASGLFGRWMAWLA